MLDEQMVKEQLAGIAALTPEELQRFEVMITTAASFFDSSGDTETDRRLALRAAARVNYWIALAKAAENPVTSFKAGDISITENADAVGKAYSLLETLESESEDGAGSGFAFRTV